MIGCGSGNWYRWDARITTESQHRVDIRWMRKQNYLKPGALGLLSWSCNGEKTGSVNFRMEADNIILSYRHRPHSGEWEDVEQVVPITKTPCNFGGYRKWFSCPHCWKRVTSLYGVEKYFLCRHCYNLTYESSNSFPIKRLFDKAGKLREQLGGGTLLMDPIADRPKGLHHSTYNRIVAEINRLEDVGNTIMFEQYGMRF